MEPLGGIRFGMQRDRAVEMLREYARSLGEEVTVKSYEDGLGSGSAVLEGAEWRFAFSYDLYDEVYYHAVMYRQRPAGREASVAWTRRCIAGYGPPNCVALFVPSVSRPVDASLEWFMPAGHLRVSLMVSDAGEWDVREDLNQSPVPREELVPLGAHREALARLGDRLARRREHGGWSDEFLARMATWVRARAEVLDRLAPLLPGVPLWDGRGDVAEATRALDTIEAGLPECDGVFVVVGMAEPKASELRHRAWTVAGAAGLRVVQLTWHPSFDREPTTGEPMPAPPTEQIDFVEGPLAARLLNDEWLRGLGRGLRCEVVPARFVRVDGAVEEWLRVPAAADGPRSRKYAFTTKHMWPLRLTDPASGRSVHVNTGGSREELLRYAHALLAARRR